MELFKLLGTIAIDNSSAETALDDTVDKAEETESKLSNTFSKIGAAVVAAFAVDKIIDFGTAVTDLADSAKAAMNSFSASTGENIEEFEGVLQSIYKNNYGKSFDDIAVSMASVKQQMGDIDSKELEKVTTSAIVLRDTFDFEVNETMRAAKMLMDQFGLTSEEAFNLIAQGAQKGLNKNDDLLDSINEYSVHYKQLGLTAEEFFASLENGTAAGTFSVDKLGDAMKEFGIRVKDNSDSSAEAFKLLGYDSKKLFKTFNKGGKEAADMTAILIDELTSMPDGVEKTTAGVALFGTMWEDLGAEGIKALGDLSGSITATADTMEQINDIKYDSFSSAMEGVKRTFETSLLMPIGEMLLPLLTDTIPQKLEAIEKYAPVILNAFSTALTGIQTAVSTAINIITPILQGAVEIISPVVQTFVNLIKEMWSAVQKNLGFITEIFETLYQKIQDTIMSRIQPVIASFMDIIDALWGMVETDFNLILGIFETVATFIYENVINYVVPAIETFINWVIDLWLSIEDNIVRIIEQFTEFHEFISDVIHNVILPVIQSFIDMIAEVLKENKDKLDKLKELFTTIFAAISDVVAVFVGFAKDIIYPFLLEAVEAFKSNLDNVKGVFQSVFDAIGGIIDFFISAFKGDWEGMFEAIKTTASSIWDAVVGIFETAWKGIKSIFSLGTVNQFFGNVLNAIKSIFGGIAGWFKDTFTKAWEGVRDVFSKGGEIFTGIVDGITEFFRTIVNGLIGGINNVIAVPFNAINGMLQGIKNVSVAGVTPFSWISTFAVPQIPLLEKGGVLEEGQVGLLEGNGAEAVVPLDQNEKWINKVAQDMNAATGNNALLQKILDVLMEIREVLPEELAEAVAQLRFEISNREFARLVRG